MLSIQYLMLSTIAVEMIALLPDHGVQMENRSWISCHRTFVPKDMLCGVLINEVIRRVCGALLILPWVQLSPLKILLLLFVSSYTGNTC